MTSGSRMEGNRILSAATDHWLWLTDSTTDMIRWFWTCVTHYDLISTLAVGLLATAAVIISLTDWVLGDVHRRTRLSGKPIPHRRCRSHIMLKIVFRTDADSRKNDAASFAIKLVWKADANGILLNVVKKWRILLSGRTKRCRIRCRRRSVVLAVNEVCRIVSCFIGNRQTYLLRCFAAQFSTSTHCTTIYLYSGDRGYVGIGCR